MTYSPIILGGPKACDGFHTHHASYSALKSGLLLENDPPVYCQINFILFWIRIHIAQPKMIQNNKRVVLLTLSTIVL